ILADNDAFGARSCRRRDWCRGAPRESKHAGRIWYRLSHGHSLQEAAMRAIGAILAFLMLLPFGATAKTITVRGEGFASCAVWLREHTARTDRQPVQDSWILGYVVATAGMLDIPGVEDVSSKFRNADLVAWVDDYCGSH